MILILFQVIWLGISDLWCENQVGKIIVLMHPPWPKFPRENVKMILLNFMLFDLCLMVWRIGRKMELMELNWTYWPINRVIDRIRPIPFYLGTQLNLCRTPCLDDNPNNLHSISCISIEPELVL